MTSRPTQKVLAFMSSHSIPMGQDNTVTVNIDDSCDMAEVLVNGKSIMMGNHWDFRPECHGLSLPSFSGHTDLARVFQCALQAAGNRVEMVENLEWEYE